MKNLILISALITASVLCAVLIFIIIRDKRRITRLTESIDNFMKHGEFTEFSPYDNSIARLQSEILKLEARFSQEKEYSKKEAKNNTEFISDISHQLKTPLAALRLYCEMEEQDGIFTHTDKKLLLIDKMEKLIANVLKLEKIRGDTYTMDFKEEEVSDIILELKTEFEALYPKKILRINGTGKFRCDKHWLREAVANVIKNACEHTKEDGIIEINITGGDKSVEIIIEDNGGGAPTEDLHMLFRRFHRTKNAAPESTGIGLPVTKAIVQKHHGTVTAENSNKGLRISMCFPVTDANILL